MGDPPKFRNKYSRPKILWDVDRLKEEKSLKKEYGLKNMRELWMSVADLRKYRREARRLLSLTQEEKLEGSKGIVSKLSKFGVLKKASSLEDILSLTVRDFLERRLQTIVYKKGLARTITQSRQLITHGFISIGGNTVNVPSFFVDTNVEPQISYSRKIDIEVKKDEAVSVPASEQKTHNQVEKKQPKEQVQKGDAA